VVKIAGGEITRQEITPSEFSPAGFVATKAGGNDPRHHLADRIRGLETIGPYREQNQFGTIGNIYGVQRLLQNTRTE